MVGYERHDIRLIIYDEHALAVGTRFCHGLKLSGVATLRQLGVCHEHVTLSLHSLGQDAGASFANHSFR